MFMERKSPGPLPSIKELDVRVGTEKRRSKEDPEPTDRSTSCPLSESDPRTSNVFTGCVGEIVHTLPDGQMTVYKVKGDCFSPLRREGL